jgi:tetratricopeptide (TPR) repeat protein
MNALEFDNTVKKLRVELEKKKAMPQKLEELIIERLKTENITYDTTVLELVYAWRNFESENEYQEKSSCLETTRIIDSLLEFAENRVQLQAALLAVKGDIFYEKGKAESAADAFSKAVEKLHPLHLEVDSQRIGSMVKLGQALFLLNKMDEAEKLYLDVLSYPWYLVTEDEIREIFEKYYIDAGLGLIECRKGNLAALEDTYFVPATHSILLPELERAIRETKEMQ